MKSGSRFRPERHTGVLSDFFPQRYLAPHRLDRTHEPCASSQQMTTEQLRDEAERIEHETPLSYFEAYVLAGTGEDLSDVEIARGTPFSARRVERTRAELREEKRSIEDEMESRKRALSALEENL